MKKNFRLSFFLLAVLIIPALCQASVTILTNSNPNHIITSGSDEQIYGTSASNQITLERGARAELFNFPGQNSIQIQSSSYLFTVSRSGSVVTFQGSDGTFLKMPATSEAQTIYFNGDDSRVLQIHNNQVMLDDQGITSNLYNSLKRWPYEMKCINIPLIWPNHFSEDPSFTTINDLIVELIDLGINCVKIGNSYGVMNYCNDNEFDPELEVPCDESDVISFANKLQSAGIMTILAPFSNILNTISGSGGCDRPQPEDVQIWFDNFTIAALEQANLAQATNSDYFILFLDEIQHLTFVPELTERWVDLIKQIREVYSGKITSTIWTNGIYDPIDIPNSILNELDVLGIGFFPQFTDKTNPTTEELVESYYSNIHDINLVSFLESLHERTGKRIFITDRAFHSFDGSNMNEVLIFNDAVPKSLDEEEQRDQYEAFFRVMSAQNWDWFEGVIFSSWNRLSSEQIAYLPAYLGPLGETIEGKLAEETVRDWFK